MSQTVFVKQNKFQEPENILKVNAGYTDILIIIRMDYDIFMRDWKESFTKDLSYLVGYNTEEIHDPKFWKGCVFFEAYIPWVAAKRLLQTLKLKEIKKDNERVDELNEFMRLYNISSISSRAINKL